MHGATAGMERQASARYGVRLKQARLPWVKTLEQFDFTFQPGIDRKVVRELAGLAFVERSENVILLGPPVSENSSGHSSWRESGGCGTSGTVYATGQTDRDTDESETGKPAGASAAATELCPGVDPDEIGYLPMNREEASLFFRLLNRRYEKRASY